MSEHNQDITNATMLSNAWSSSADKNLSEDTPCRPPPLTRMSTSVCINGVIMTKDEMMYKMNMDTDKANEKKD
jgi:hypothetical protein